jgi:catechol 2,3-dioxygenase-like lactoylglutathione lyase family enzyme
MSRSIPSSEPADPRVEASVARPGGSYLAIPVNDVRESARFYQSVFGWRLRGEADRPSFSDGAVLLDRGLHRRRRPRRPLRTTDLTTTTPGRPLHQTLA